MKMKRKKNIEENISEEKWRSKKQNEVSKNESGEINENGAIAKSVASKGGK